MSKSVLIIVLISLSLAGSSPATPPPISRHSGLARQVDLFDLAYDRMIATAIPSIERVDVTWILRGPGITTTPYTYLTGSIEPRGWILISINRVLVVKRAGRDDVMLQTVRYLYNLGDRLAYRILNT